MNWPKRPKVRKEPTGPQVRTGPTFDFREHDIGWRFGILDVDGPFGWKACDQKTLMETIHERVKSFETMRWGEILGKHLHQVPIERLDGAARRRLEEIGQDDVEELFCLRIAKRPRIWGIRDRMFFRVVWWDPGHDVCPMNITDNQPRSEALWDGGALAELERAGFVKAADHK